MQEEGKPTEPDGAVRPPAFCGDGELGYLRSRTRFAPGEGLALDEAYRLAHLPLVAPEHPRVMARREGTGYEMGRHEPIFSLVLPIPCDALHPSAAYQELEGELQASPFAHKIAWSLLERRRAKLHATICGALATGEKPPPLDARQRRELAQLGPCRSNCAACSPATSISAGSICALTRASRRHQHVPAHPTGAGRGQTDLYLVGIFNLVDDLDA